MPWMLLAGAAALTAAVFYFRSKGVPLPILPPESSITLTAAPGAKSIALAKGGTVTVNLPTGGQWGDWTAVSQGGTSIPVQLPPSLTASVGGATDQSSTPAQLLGVTGTGVVTFAWVDASDAQQYMNLTITTPA